MSLGRCRGAASSWRRRVILAAADAEPHAIVAASMAGSKSIQIRRCFRPGASLSADCPDDLRRRADPSRTVVSCSRLRASQWRSTRAIWRSLSREAGSVIVASAIPTETAVSEKPLHTATGVVLVNSVTLP